MTINDFVCRRMASPLDRGGRSIWRAFLDRIMEGRTRKAEAEIAQYLRRCGRQLPARQGPLIESP